MVRAMTVAIIDYGSGNLHSAQKAFERAAREAGLDRAVVVTADPEAVRRADRIVLPGVGAFADCRAGLDAIPGMIEALEETVRRRGRPFLGICVGMQLMAERGLRISGHRRASAGSPATSTASSRPTRRSRSRTWAGTRWRCARAHPLLAGIPTGAAGLHAYFVHSYHLRRPTRPISSPPPTMAARSPRSSRSDNMAGTQFHPEKSQNLGLALIANFLRWRP